MTREEFEKTDWRMSYEQYQLCNCLKCDKANCPHGEVSAHAGI